MAQGAPRDGLIVVGTQTLGQWLVIDVDFIIIDLCAPDTLLQQLGRMQSEIEMIGHRPSVRVPPSSASGSCRLVRKPSPATSASRRIPTYPTG